MEENQEPVGRAWKLDEENDFIQREVDPQQRWWLRAKCVGVQGQWDVYEFVVPWWGWPFEAIYHLRRLPARFLEYRCR